MDAKAGQLGVHYFRSEVVRVEVLMLLWAVLTTQMRPLWKTTRSWSSMLPTSFVLTHWVNRIVKHSLNHAQNRWHWMRDNWQEVHPLH